MAEQLREELAVAANNAACAMIAGGQLGAKVNEVVEYDSGLIQAMEPFRQQVNRAREITDRMGELLSGLAHLQVEFVGVVQDLQEGAGNIVNGVNNGPGTIPWLGDFVTGCQTSVASVNQISIGEAGPATAPLVETARTHAALAETAANEAVGADNSYRDFSDEKVIVGANIIDEAQTLADIARDALPGDVEEMQRDLTNAQAALDELTDATDNRATQAELTAEIRPLRDKVETALTNLRLASEATVEALERAHAIERQQPS